MMMSKERTLMYLDSEIAKALVEDDYDRVCELTDKRIERLSEKEEVQLEAIA
ncbi:hypothetical protein LCM10_04725 [Rossellomorea aquimaris]|uniref:hypothetical protein n=1 Tax=Rossellomorea aquimaris TaxID=189382 RepID=UPI001CD3D175|nr:hypothetical protein [Rossellomorea aquimaris]MCA1054283.1 hypothetical protein [Rossellomorea aquimaris]